MEMLKAVRTCVVYCCAALLISLSPAFGQENNGVDGLFWESMGGPNGDTNLRDIVIDPNDDSIWYVGSSSNGLYVTRDAGTTWETHLSGNIGAVAFDPGIARGRDLRDPADDSVIYASSISDLYRTVDQGLTWDLVVSLPESIPGPSGDSSTFIDSILVSASPGLIVVGLSGCPTDARVYLSTDWGVTWGISWETSIGYHIWDLVEAPDTGNWFFCTEDSNHADNPVVMRSQNQGMTWDEISALTGVPSSGHGLELAVSPVSNTVYFLRESSVMSTSSDSGTHWSYSGHFVGFGSALLLDPNCPNRVFGGEIVRGTSTGGVYVSEDWGQTFDYLGLPGNTISSLALDSTSSNIVAVSNYGLWVMNFYAGGSLLCEGLQTEFTDGFESGDIYRWLFSGS